MEPYVKQSFKWYLLLAHLLFDVRDSGFGCEGSGTQSCRRQGRQEICYLKIWASGNVCNAENLYMRASFCETTMFNRYTYILYRGKLGWKAHSGCWKRCISFCVGGLTMLSISGIDRRQISPAAGLTLSYCTSYRNMDQFWLSHGWRDLHGFIDLTDPSAHVFIMWSSFSIAAGRDRCFTR